MDNPFHKPAGFYKPQAPPTPVHKLTTQQRFQLMFGFQTANQTTPMNKVKLKAESDIDSLNAALDIYRTYEEEFDSLKEVSILLTPRGIELQTTGDARAVARTLCERFDIIFTRRRVTDRAYDWVSEIQNVQIALILVEFVDEDLTGSIVPLSL